MSRAVKAVIAERRRQIEQEGWTPEHDDEHTDRSLAKAGALYADVYAEGYKAGDDELDDPPCDWPWADEWWKPKGPRRDLVRAAALIIAEIERLDRMNWKQLSLPSKDTVFVRLSLRRRIKNCGHS